MLTRNRCLQWTASFGAVALGMLIACGGGGGASRAAGATGGSLEVRVSAGGPVSGATITVYAVDEEGQVEQLAAGGGVLGVAGPTDAEGKATVTFAKEYIGPIQVVASGAGMTYPDPMVPVEPGKTPAVVRIPAGFTLSSFISRYWTGTTAVVPVTLLTTLADHEVLAFARGLHPLHPGAKKLTEALTARDPLWVQHVASKADAWDPSALRTTVPADLAQGATTLVDSAYANLIDIGLSALAAKTAADAGYGAGSSAMTAITLVQLLQQDLDADAVLNGKTSAGMPIATGGTTPVVLDSHFMRQSLAYALDTWIQNAGLNLSTIDQGDLVAAGVFSAMSGDASDLFGDPPMGAYQPVDWMPPEVALVAEPPRYTNASSVTLTMTATDQSGVAGVFVRVGGTRYEAVAQGDGTWRTTVERLPAAGQNVITIWAKDRSPAANEGEDLEAPYRLTRTVLLDNGAPEATYDASFASYYDERSMQVSETIPPSYTVGPRVSVPETGGEFFKVATRLGAGAVATAAELETTNNENIPLLRFGVAGSADADSPIQEATFRVSITCASCASLPDATGTLLASSTGSGFILPLATEYVPALGQVQGAAQLSVSISLVDAAGNSWTRSTPWSFAFHVMGPPLIVREDVNYAAVNDGKSTYPYKLVNATFATLYDPGATVFQPENNVRLARYVVTNPAPQPVALAASFVGGVWSATETWTAVTMPGGTAYYTRTPGNAHRSPYGVTYETACAGRKTNLAPRESPPMDVLMATWQEFACAGLGSFTPTGGSPECAWRENPTVSGPQQSGALATNAYYPSSYGADGTAVMVTPSGRYVVPAASASGPGVVLLYVVRPRAGLQERIPVAGWNGLQFTQSLGQATSFVHGWGVAGRCSDAGAGPCCYYAEDGSFLASPVHQHTVYQYSRALTYAVDEVRGTLALQTFGMAAGAEFGEAQAIPGGSFDLTETISH